MLGADNARNWTKKYQVFVSSTQNDLKEERRSVIEAILAMNHIPVGMELFEAGNEDQWTYIKNRILEVDYYIVIVAERYGSIGPDGISYTEMEYRFALENDVPIAALLLDDAKRPHWPSAKIDFNHHDKLGKFRSLCQERMVSYWTDAGTLASKCQLALTGLIRRHKRPGWISGDNAITNETISELARLSKENADLKTQISSLGASRDKSLERAIDRISTTMDKLLDPIIDSFNMSQSTKEKITPILSKTTLWDIISYYIVPFFDGILSDRMNTLLFRYFERKLSEYDQVADSHVLSEVADTIGALFRSWGLVEAYTAPTGDGKPGRWLKMSDLCRRAFDEAPHTPRSDVK